VLEDETIRNVVSHSLLAVHLGVKHFKTEVQDSDGKDKTETQSQTPCRLQGIFATDSKKDDGNNSAKQETTTEECWVRNILNFYTVKIIHTYSMMKLPQMTNQKPRLRPDSSALSLVAVEQHGYSPPTPTPVTPRAIHNIQKRP
jgi:hypothetical protein